jgi:adenylate kinase
MNIILLGFPGAGKGTQAVILKDEYGFRHISTGDLIRAEIASGSELGRKFAEIIKAGNLVSDELAIAILKKVTAEEAKSIVFDGFPRTVPQAQTLDEYLARRGEKTDKVILIELSEEEVLKRLTSRRVCKTCGALYSIFGADYTGKCNKCSGILYTRADDTLESAKHRLEVFKKETQPLLGYYADRVGISRVDGSKAVEGVAMEIARVLDLKK